MITPSLPGYLERQIPYSGDQLSAASVLASCGLDDDFVVYEADGAWSFASGVLAEVTLDRTGATMRADGEVFLPWDGAPLPQVRRLLAKVPVDGWRAYGWAVFELAYAKDGDLSHVGDQRLLHLVVPRTEVRFAAGRATVRAIDPGALETISALLSAEPAEVGGPCTPLDVRRIGAEDYERTVSLAVADIKAHRLQKVICSRVVPVEGPVDLLGTYVTGRRGNTPARSFLFRLGGIEAAGFSPEIVVHVTGDGHVVSQPLAGTRALTTDSAINERLRAELLADPKEIYEHAISVQTAYDELLPVCADGTVTVEEFMRIKERGSVQHLASRVGGQLAAGRSPWDAFAAVFPAVTASGVPKPAAFASIRAHEPGSRGLYSGTVLTVDHGGEMDAALVLRAIYRQDGVTWLRAGAGIVDQSLPQREFEETCEKLESVARFLVSSAGTAPPASRRVGRISEPSLSRG